LSGVKVTGFKELQKQLKDMERKARELEKGVNVSFEELFNENFMSKYTKFNSFEDFLTAGNFDVESQEDFEAIPDEEFDAHVANNSKFNDWSNMMNTAGTEYTATKLGFS